MHHYTYMIKANDMFYIGARSCDVLPEEDSYFSSCKTLLAWIKDNGVTNLIKDIISVFPTRALAIEHEIELHNFYDVAANKLFWNKAKQTSIGFDTAGTHIPKTEEHKAKIGAAHKGRKLSEEQKRSHSEKMKGRKLSDEHKVKLTNSLIGRKHSDETKQKISLSNKGKKCSNEQKEILKNNMIGMVVCFDIEQKKTVKVTKEEYHSNKNKYKTNNSKDIKELEAR